MTGPNPMHYGWWLASRSAGIVALVAVTMSVGLGLAMAGRLSRRPGMAKVLRVAHEQFALVGLVAIAAHGITLMGDPWLHPSPAGITVPFAMHYRPSFTAMGIVGGYLAAILGLSFYARRRIGARLWRRAHRATVVVYLLAVIHTLGAGTDATTPWLRGFLLVTGIPIVALFLRRVFGSRAPQRAPGERGIRERRPAIEAAR